MTKRGAGVSFIAISASLISCKYISAALFGSGLSSWSGELFNAMLANVGNTLENWSIAALLIGILYIASGEYDEWKVSREESS